MHEKSTQKEVDRLQSAIRNLLDEAGQRTKIEVGVYFLSKNEKAKEICICIRPMTTTQVRASIKALIFDPTGRGQPCTERQGLPLL